MIPRRIQRRRTKGWTMPPGAIYVGRPTKWGNPFVVGEMQPWPHRRDLGDFRVETAEQAVGHAGDCPVGRVLAEKTP